MRSSNDFRLARRKYLQNSSKLWTNNESLLARSGPDYPLRFANVKWPVLLECKIRLECTPKVSNSSDFISFLFFLSIFFIKNTSKVSLKLRDARKLKGARIGVFKGCAKIKGARKLTVLREPSSGLCIDQKHVDEKNFAESYLIS